MLGVRSLLGVLLALASGIVVEGETQVIYTFEPPIPSVDLAESIEQRTRRTRAPTPARSRRTRVPTNAPTAKRTRRTRTRTPTSAPTAKKTRRTRTHTRTRTPTSAPTAKKTRRTRAPTANPTKYPTTHYPTAEPTKYPTRPPTTVPTKFPTSKPTKAEIVSCKAGTYYWGFFNNKHYCVLCDVGYRSDGCKHCKPDPKATLCAGCERGTYLQKQGDAECQECPVGKWQNKDGESFCWKCTAGSYNPQPGQKTCSECPIGKYQAGQAALECISCNKCGGGTYGTTKHPKTSSSRGCVCQKCPKGKFTPRVKPGAIGHMKCFECAAGKFQDFEGIPGCDKCPTGKFQSDIGQEACDRCPSMYTTTYTGASTVGQCDKVNLHCNSGKYAVREAPAYVGHIGYAGVHTPSRGVHIFGKSGHVSRAQPFARVLCLDCPAGKYGIPGGGAAYACRLCPIGKFQPDIGKKTCQMKHAVEIDSLAKLPCLEACAKHYKGSHLNRQLSCDIGCSISATGYGKKNLGYGIGERPYRVVHCNQLPLVEWTAACLDGMQFSGGRKCTHLTCEKQRIRKYEHSMLGFHGKEKEFESGIESIVETDRIVVKHHNEEEGGYHICRHNAYTQKCTCQCY